MEAATAPETDTPLTRQRAPTAPRRRFLCRSCNTASLVAVVAPDAAARCVRCGFQTDDLLTLIPTRPVPLSVVVLGEGWRGFARAAAFAAACALALLLILAPR